MALAPAVIYGGRALATTGAGNIIKTQASNFLKWFGYGSLAVAPVALSSTSGVNQNQNNNKKLLLTAGVVAGAYLVLKK